jgi:hypothetical protein
MYLGKSKREAKDLVELGLRLLCDLLLVATVLAFVLAGYGLHRCFMWIYVKLAG